MVGGVWQGACMIGACMAGETATAVDSVHPTGMHSCTKKFFMIISLIIEHLSIKDPTAFWQHHFISNRGYFGCFI